MDPTLQIHFVHEALKWLHGDDASETTPQQNEITEAVSEKQKHPAGTRKTSLLRPGLPEGPTT